MVSLMKYFATIEYSTVSNKRGGLQILEKIKVKLGCIDAKTCINCVKLIAFIYHCYQRESEKIEKC